MSKAQRKLVVTQKDVKEHKTEKKVEVDVKLTKEQQKELAAQKTISAQIRYLNKEGISNAQIARQLGKRYQHVRNVLETPLKRKTNA